MRGSCKFGAGCRNLHDDGAYARQLQSELDGTATPLPPVAPRRRSDSEFARNLDRQLNDQGGGSASLPPRPPRPPSDSDVQLAALMQRREDEAATLSDQILAEALAELSAGSGGGYQAGGGGGGEGGGAVVRGDTVAARRLQDQEHAELLHSSELEAATLSDQILAQALAQELSGPGGQYQQQAARVGGGGGGGLSRDRDYDEARRLQDQEDAETAQALSRGEDISFHSFTRRPANVLSHDEAYARALQAELDHAAAPEFLPMFDGDDPFSDAALARLLHGNVSPQSSPRQQDAAVLKAVEEGMREAQARRQAAARAHVSDVNLASLASHSQNVHNAAVEEPALQSFDDFHARMPPGFDERAMLRELVTEISRRPAGLDHTVVASAVQALGDNSGMATVYNHSPGKTYVIRTCICCVYNLCKNHTSKADMLRRLAEEISEGVGKCPAGRVGRIFNTVRGFISMDFEPVENSQRPALSDAVTPILRSNQPLPQKLEALNRLLDAYSVLKPEDRQVWVDALNALVDE